MCDDRTKIQQEHGKKHTQKNTTSTCQQLQEVKQWNTINQNRTQERKNYTQLSEDSTQSKSTT